MKEFWVYTGLRAVLFLATLVVVVGVWLLVADQVPVRLTLAARAQLERVASALSNCPC